MSKLLRLLFLLLLIVNILLFSSYFFIKNNTRESENEDVLKGQLDIANYTETATSRFRREEERLIQASFIKIESNFLFYKDREKEIGEVESLLVDNSVLYVCRKPTFSPEIVLDLNNPGHTDFLELTVLGAELDENERIAISTMISDGVEKVNYVISERCTDVE